MNDELQIDRGGGVTTVTMNRPAVKNAMTSGMCVAMTELFRSMPGDSDTRVVVLQGSGSDFCSGGDLAEIGKALPDGAAARGDAMAAEVRRLSIPLALALHEVPQPIVASVRGYAVGVAAQLVVAADLVVASETARLVIPQARLAHSVDHGESWTLPRKVGMARATQIMLLGDAVSAADAERYGLINWLVPDAMLEQRTAEIASRLATGATIAIREIKQLLRHSSARSYAGQLDAEVEALRRCTATDDFVEAMQAFAARRKPVFSGR
jgi:2-(1,2-epoxy-1,2-dihydrophenyl)acetyl-CoA isomerase